MFETKDAIQGMFGLFDTSANPFTRCSQTCWEGIEMSVDIINEKRIKLVVNGGCLNPKGLAEKTHELVSLISLFPS